MNGEDNVVNRCDGILFSLEKWKNLPFSITCMDLEDNKLSHEINLTPKKNVAWSHLYVESKSQIHGSRE